MSGVEYLVHAKAHLKAEKGAPQHYIAVADLTSGDREWGRREVPPDYCYIRITDLQPGAEADGYLDGGYNDYTVTHVRGDQWRVTMKPEVLALAGDEKGVSAKIETDLIGVFGGRKDSQHATKPVQEKVFTFDKGATKEEIEAHMRDRHRVQFLRGRFLFPVSAVDQALLNKDGRLITTRAAILSSIIDRLA